MAHHWQSRLAEQRHADPVAVTLAGTHPVEQVWQYLRANYLSNRVFDDFDAIIDAACDAWRKLVEKPQQITSIGMRSWAHKGHL